MSKDNKTAKQSKKPLETAPSKAGAIGVLWSPPSAIAWAVLIFVGAQFVASLAVSFYPLIKHWPQARVNDWVNGVYVQFWYILLAEALTFGAVWWLLRWRRLGLKSIGWRRFSPWALVYGLAGYGVYFVIYFVLFSIAQNFVHGINVTQQQAVGFQSASGFCQLVATFASLVVLPPLVEETLFRGFLFTSFRKKMTFATALILTSILFAAPHLLEAKSGGLLWIAALDTFTLSFVLCYLREKTGSLWPGVFTHGIKNAVAFFVLFIAPLIRPHVGG